MSRNNGLGIPKANPPTMPNGININARVGEIAISGSSGTNSTTSTLAIPIADTVTGGNLYVSLACTGGPVLVGLTGDGVGSSDLFADNNGQVNASYNGIVRIMRFPFNPTFGGAVSLTTGGTLVGEVVFGPSGNTFESTIRVPGTFSFIDLPGPGTIYYMLFVYCGGSASTMHVGARNSRLFAKELI